MHARTFNNPNTFANSPLDRAGHRRLDTAWLGERMKDPTTLVIPFHKLQAFTIKGRDGRAEAGFLRPGLAEPLMGADAPLIFLGIDKGGAYFAADISAAGDPEKSGPLAGLGTFREMRGLAMEIDGKDAAILGQAKALIDWHRRHRFCANCGAPTALADAGYKRFCATCKSEHFPRTDPVVIMLATLGDKCLLGRGKQFPAGMYSALAGFIEPGESIEEAVARELYEEAGIDVSAVRYHSTQPWPFPSSLMIGCIADAASEAITVDESELAEARWIDRATVKDVLAGKGPKGLWVPPPFAIAHQLIKTWAET